jgi:hypothetical protein
MSKVSNDHMRKTIESCLKGAEEKKREFVETVELQIGLKNYDPQKDKRFAGNIKLPHIPRPKMRVCVLGDAYHCEKAAAMGLEFKNAEGLKNFNKNKKLIKKFGARSRRATVLPLRAAPPCCACVPRAQSLELRMRVGLRAVSGALERTQQRPRHARGAGPRRTSARVAP